MPEKGPHTTLFKFYISQAASLDHCMWFHEPSFNCDEWMLWEQYSEKAGTPLSLMANYFLSLAKIAIQCETELTRRRDYGRGMVS